MRAIVLLFICLFMSSVTTFARVTKFTKVTDGNYPALVKILGEGGYEPQTLFKLRNPTLLWFDESWFRNKGYSIDADFEQNLLDELAWAIPDPKEPANAYTRESRIGYADRYGGKGMDGHRGGGRTAILGSVQIKGIGVTSLVNAYAAKTDPEHGSGRVNLMEGVSEIIASQIADYELPYGANKIVAMIATGTFNWDPDRKIYSPRVLIVREDPLRPGHFITNLVAKRTQREQDRISFVMDTLPDALPQAENANPSSRAEKLQQGMAEFIRRHAKVLAYSYAHRLLHSAFSPSNEEMSGKALDYGAFMALEGYSRAGRFGEGEYNGETKAVVNVIKEFIANLKKTLPAKDRGNIPTINQAIKAFQSEYESALAFEFVTLTGFPEEFLVNLRSSDDFKLLSETLRDIAKDGNDKKIDALNSFIGRTGAYDVPKILQKMATTVMMNPQDFSSDQLITNLDESLKSEILEVKVRQDLVQSYSKVLRAVAKLATKQGISTQALTKYLFYAAELQNRRLAHLINDESSSDYWVKTVEDYVKTSDAKKLRLTINQALQDSRRTFRDRAPYTLVLNEKPLENGKFSRQVFDLKTNRTRTIIWTSGTGSCANYL